ncbi:MAG: hypothetical protein IKU15_00155 [Clostridia bacterium]|nr:hypothetical protein [Clostridia bacterium]
MKILFTNENITFETENKEQYTHNIDDLFDKCIASSYCAVTNGCHTDCPLYSQTSTTAECMQIIAALSQYRIFN